MHYDNSHNANLMLHGRKRWLLLPPEALPSAYLNSAFVPSAINSRLVNPLTYNRTEFPDFTERVWEVVQEPGDVLFLPRHWLHHVQTLEPTIAINNWPSWSSDRDTEDGYYTQLTGQGELKQRVMQFLKNNFMQTGRNGNDAALQMLFSSIIAQTMVGSPFCPGTGANINSDRPDISFQCVSRFTKAFLSQRYSWLEITDLVDSFPIQCEPLEGVLADKSPDRDMQQLIDEIVPLFTSVMMYNRVHILRDWMEHTTNVARAMKRFREVPFYFYQCLQ